MPAYRPTRFLGLLNSSMRSQRLPLERSFGVSYEIARRLPATETYSARACVFCVSTLKLLKIAGTANTCHALLILQPRGTGPFVELEFNGSGKACWPPRSDLSKGLGAAVAGAAAPLRRVPLLPKTKPCFATPNRGSPHQKLESTGK